MLGAWQLGDIEKLHQDYGDDVVIVNGSWAPPIFGWTNYLAIYQQQHARMQQVRMDRSNTYIKVSGTVGWACFQWVIVLNHTSVAPRVPQAAPASAPPGQQQPAKPAPR